MNTTVQKNKNALLNERTHRSLQVTHMPFYYHLHIFMPCNQKCIMCKPDGKHPQDVLPFEKFVDFFNQIKPYAEHITLIGGEPLLYPWIYEAIELLAQHEIAVSINTNITMLDEKLSEKLLTLNELHLKCSIDAMTREMYHKIRGTDKFEQVQKNLMRFAQMKKNMPHIKQILVYVVMQENMQEVLPFIDFAKTLSPERIEFHPVRHVTNWVVNNKTGWTFDGKEQSCEFFADEYNLLMKQAGAKCEQEGISYETLYV